MRLALSLVVAVLVGGVVAVWLPTMALRRRHVTTPGTRDVIVRCARGHLFITIWIPSVSLKAVRLGTKRYQHCPVGHHWNMVTAMNASELSDADRIEAARVHDVRIP